MRPPRVGSWPMRRTPRGRSRAEARRLPSISEGPGSGPSVTAVPGRGQASRQGLSLARASRGPGEADRASQPSSSERTPAMTETTPRTDEDGPTVVLVHGAFADSSSWNEVIEQLQAAGVKVQAVSNPLRGINADSAYVTSALRQVPGPVVAVAHSYGGAMITNAATNAANVVALVYVAAFAPDEGETLQDVEGNS